MVATEGDMTMVVEAARRDDPDAWDQLFKRYQLPLYAYVWELVHNEQTSLDIVQEAFINAVRYIRNLQDSARFGSWMFSIAHQKCVQHWRKHRYQEYPLEDQLESVSEEDSDPRSWLIRQEQEELFRTLLDKLPAVQKAVLVLYFMEDFSLEEIARITEAELGTVKSRLHYAKKALRQLLENTL